MRRGVAAWEELERCVDRFMTIDDAPERAMRELATGSDDAGPGLCALTQRRAEAVRRPSRIKNACPPAANV
ncbi:hypothetical protein WT08_12245 [Burkholderia sp. MSMB1552]|nr:hypothetical protein WT08_12245 [Burkholderia sp. MSMB1552]KWZ50809.1 hypothetical protein WS92_26015 [Burkholderia sp. MSMB1588]